MSTAFLFNNKMMKYGTHVMGISSSPTPPVPVIPANTVRVRTSDGNPPVKGEYATYESATLVEGTSDVYDVYKSGTSFSRLLLESSNTIEVLCANTTGITDLSDMFNSCWYLTSVPLFDTSSATNMAGMLSHCAITSVPLFDTSNVTSMYMMLSRCQNLTSVPLFDTSKVTDMRYMFDGCASLTSVPLFDTSNVTNMTHMFENCGELLSVPLFDTSKVTDMQNMFYWCKSLTSVPLFNTSNVTDMEYMFSHCYGLTTIPLINTSKVTHMGRMFDSCYNVQSGALALYQQASTQTTPPSSHAGAFGDCGINTTTGAAELAQIPSDWK